MDASNSILSCNSKAVDRSSSLVHVIICCTKRYYILGNTISLRTSSLSHNVEPCNKTHNETLARADCVQREAKAKSYLEPH